MEINLDDLKRILSDGRLAVSLAGAACIHCNVVSHTIEAAAEHDAQCDKHPMAARIAALESELAEARKDGERLDWLHERMAHVFEWTTGKFGVESRSGYDHWLVKPIYDTPRAAIDDARGVK